MSEMLRYRGRRILITGVSLEPGEVYEVTPLDRKYGREGFWVEIVDDGDVCRCHYDNRNDFMLAWEVVK